MDNSEVFAYVSRNLDRVQRPEFYPLLPEDSGPEGSPAFFRRVCELVFPAVADYLGAGRLPAPEIFCPDDGGFKELANLIAQDSSGSCPEMDGSPGTVSGLAKDFLKSEMSPVLITFASRPPAIWSGYFRPQSQLFYREAAPEEIAHYVQLSLNPSRGAEEYSMVVEGVASGVVSEIGSVLPGFRDVANRERARQIRAVYELKAAEQVPETVEFDQYVFGRAWYALATLGMKPEQKREFLSQAAAR